MFNSPSSVFATVCAGLGLGAAMISCACAARVPRVVSAPFRAPQVDISEHKLDYRPDVDVFELANGLRVALVPESGTNMVRVDVRYLVGSVEDPVGSEGLAHTVEHATFLARETPESPTLSSRLGDAALTNNAYTNWDETHYYSTGFPDRLREMLDVERVRMATRCEQLDPAAFEREREIVVQEIRQRDDGGAQRRVREAVFGASHPYARDVGGTERTVEKLGLPSICRFLEDHYGPNRAILVVSGAIDRTSVRALVRTMFSAIELQAAGKRAPLAAFAPEGKATTLDVDVEEPALVIAFGNPAWGSAPAMLHKVVVRLLEIELADVVSKDESVISSASVTSVGGYRGGALTISLSLQGGVTIDRALKVFARARKKALRRADSYVLDWLRSRLRGQLIRRLDPFHLRAQSIADYLQYGDGRQLILGELDEISAVYSGQVLHDGEKMFSVDNVRVVHLRPKKNKRPARKRLVLASPTSSHDDESVEQDIDDGEAERPLEFPSRPPPAPAREVYLGNGMRALLVSDLSHPSVDARLIFPVGYANHAERKRPGIARIAASLLEHDFARSYGERNLSRIRQALSLGGEILTEVDERSTTFRIRGLAPDTGGLLWRLHWLLESGVYSTKSLSTVQRRGRKPSEREARWDRYRQVISESLFGAGHPYARSTTRDAVKQVRVAELQAFRERYYQSRGAVLIVAGRFDADKVENQIRRLWGAWTMGGAPPTRPAIPAARPSRGHRTLALVDPDALQPTALVAFPLRPGFRKDAAARAILSRMLRHRLTAVREQQTASYGVNVSYHTGSGPGLLVISAQLDPAKAGPALRSMRDAVSSLSRSGRFNADFARARRRALQSALASTAYAESIADDLEFVTTYGLPADYAGALAKQIAELTPAELKAVIDDELAPGTGLVVLAAPEAQLAPILKAAGITRFRRVD